MWARRGEPPFVLSSKHAELFRDAVHGLSNLIGWGESEDDDFGSGVAVFDRLTQGQKQVILLQVARALLDSNEPPPKVTASLAGTVGAVYRSIAGAIGIDIETGESTALRDKVLAALDELNYWQNLNRSLEPDEPPEERPTVQNSDLQLWEDLTDTLCDIVLDDRDFESESSFVDADPTAAAANKELLGIDPDYFTAVPDDPNREQLQAIRGQLLHLVTQGSRATQRPNYSQEKVDETVIALLSLTMFDQRGVTRAWKSHAWEVLDRLCEKGWIHDPKGKAKSVVLTDDGKRVAQAMFEKHFRSGTSN